MAQPDLIAAIGRYCSYCGRFVPAGVHVEHKLPKDRYPQYELEWDNFLLACVNCNSSKGNPKLRLSDCLWPDTDNTLRAFRYTRTGLVQKAKHLPKRMRRKASYTIKVFGLDRVPGAHKSPSARDLRWHDRQSEWQKAELFKQGLVEYDTPSQRERTVVAATQGIFAIWWQVFEGDVDMRRRLRAAFVGTDTDCFDTVECARPRAGGQI